MGFVLIVGKLDSSNVAIVTDSLVNPGGADRLLKSILKVFPEADIFTSVFNRDRYPWLSGNSVFTSFIEKLPCKSLLYRHYNPLSPLAFEQFDFSNYSHVISMSAGCAKGVITGPGTHHIGIILTPPRYQWGGIVNCRASRFKSIFSLVSPVLDHYLRIWDIEASKRPDQLISISNYISNRVKSLYGLDSEVIYPGIDLNFWNDLGSCNNQDFYLVVSRLYDYKRIDLAIDVCLEKKLKLVVVGEGPDLQFLKNRVGGNENIIFKGYVTDEEVRDYFRKSKGLIFPGLEDFGLVPVEAMACGCPVIAYNKGGVAETVLDGSTGLLFNRQSKRALSDALDRFEDLIFDSDLVAARAQEFSEEIFINKFRDLVSGDTRTD